MSDAKTPAASSLPPVPATPVPPGLPAMPASKLPQAVVPVLSKFHLDPSEQELLNLATEANAGLAQIFSHIDRMSRTKLKLDALTPEQRSTYARVDGSPPDDAIAALNKLAEVLKSFAK